MASVASQLIEKVTAHVQSDSLEGVRVICAYGIYFPNKLRTFCTLKRTAFAIDLAHLMALYTLS